jgi:hypothetical protein
MTKLIERRTVGRTVVSKGALSFFSANAVYSPAKCATSPMSAPGSGEIASAYCRRILSCRSIIFVAFANVG